MFKIFQAYVMRTFVKGILRRKFTGGALKPRIDDQLAINPQARPVVDG
jgi:hypothetical protein